MVGLGLGYYSEQAFEAIHYDFLKFEEHCSVSKDHKDYRMKMMTTFNGIIAFIWAINVSCSYILYIL